MGYSHHSNMGAACFLWIQYCLGSIAWADLSPLASAHPVPHSLSLQTVLKKKLCFCRGISLTLQRIFWSRVVPTLICLCSGAVSDCSESLLVETGRIVGEARIENK